jgi:hypothetical protein
VSGVAWVVSRLSPQENLFGLGEIRGHCRACRSIAFSI